MCMRPKDSPQISVIMGVYYRKEDTTPLYRSIRSILLQTNTDFEFLICDDGSTDEAVAQIDRLAQQDHRICPVRPGGKYTLSEKLNVCLQQVKGTLIARMDDDDYAHPDRFEKQVSCLSIHPEIDFLGSNVSIWNGNRIVGERAFPEYPEMQDFLFRQPFIHPSMMFRRKALSAVGGYSEDPHCDFCEDYDLLLRLYAAGYRGMNQQEVLLDYTVLETAHNKRKMRYRWNETVTRYRRFGELGLLPRNLIYVIKPLVVGIIPEPLLARLRSCSTGCKNGGRENAVDR